MDFKKKTRLASILALVFSLSLTHCEFLGLEEDSDDDSSALFGLLLAASAGGGCGSTPAVQLTGEITSSVTVQCGVLVGTVFVRDGGTLNVPAGGQIFGADGSSLFILPGGTLNAIGTSAAPVVFTSAQAVGSRNPGDWGGIVMIGNARTNGGVLNSEGTNPQSYGGPASTNDADNSGTLSFVRIEFAGDTVGAGDELNCLSMYAVGSGTTLNNIQCHKGRDDSFEWFGGSVPAKFLIATGGSDDDFDIDVGYRGALQHLVGYKFADLSAGNSSTDARGFEWDGAVANTYAAGATIAQNSTALVANFTLVGSLGVFRDAQTDTPHAIRVREGMAGHVAHGYITGFTTAASKEIQCDGNGGGSGVRENTTVAFYNTVYSMIGTTLDNSSQCTTLANVNVSLVPATGAAIGREADVTNGVAPDLRPTVGVTGITNLKAVNPAFNIAFFDDTTYAGGIDPLGADWTAGWTTWLTR